MNSSSKTVATIGIDVGGTKIAAGLVLVSSGHVLARRLTASLPDRGGEAVLADVINIACSLQQEAVATALACRAVGIGVAELVSPQGEVISEATFHWSKSHISERIATATGLPTRVEADVRAAARAEAQVGAGKGLDNFLYVTVGTGISACLVIHGVPYAGSRGLTGTFASSRTLTANAAGELVNGVPLEQFAGGPGIATRYAAFDSDFRGSASDVMALARAGDLNAQMIVETAGRALGAAIGQLINTLDPLIVVLGGGLGVTDGIYRSALVEACRNYVWSADHRNVPIITAELNADAGFIGAAIAAALT